VEEFAKELEQLLTEEDEDTHAIKQMIANDVQGLTDDEDAKESDTEEILDEKIGKLKQQISETMELKELFDDLPDIPMTSSGKTETELSNDFKDFLLSQAKEQFKPTTIEPAQIQKTYTPTPLGELRKKISSIPKRNYPDCKVMDPRKQSAAYQEMNKNINIERECNIEKVSVVIKRSVDASVGTDLETSDIHSQTDEDEILKEKNSYIQKLETQIKETNQKLRSQEKRLFQSQIEAESLKKAYERGKAKRNEQSKRIKELELKLIDNDDSLQIISMVKRKGSKTVYLKNDVNFENENA
jgi:hypothetical protein